MLQSIARRLGQGRLTSSCDLTADPSAKGADLYAILAQERLIAAAIPAGRVHSPTGVDGLALNEIGRIRLRSTKPLFVDPYLSNRQTGALILVDESTNRTVAAGMTLGESAG